MSFLTFGQNVNGNICSCKAICMVNCICGCAACSGKGLTIQYESNKKEAKTSIFKDDTSKILDSIDLPWVKVKNSSNINAYAYYENNLYVQFIGGKIGKYLKVTNEDYNLLNHAESKGRFISNIIKAKYKYEKYISTTEDRNDRLSI
jgi:hypothetical protein